MSIIDTVVNYIQHPDIEVLGVIATLFILVSFTRTSTNQIRIINSVGSILFVVYGLSIGAFSVWLLNGICIFINIYKLYKANEPSYRKVSRRDLVSETPDIVKVKWDVKSYKDGENNR